MRFIRSNSVNHPFRDAPRGVARECHGSTRCMYAAVCGPRASVYRPTPRRRCPRRATGAHERCVGVGVEVRSPRASPLALVRLLSRPVTGTLVAVERIRTVGTEVTIPEGFGRRSAAGRHSAAASRATASTSRRRGRDSADPRPRCNTRSSGRCADRGRRCGSPRRPPACSDQARRSRG